MSRSPPTTAPATAPTPGDESLAPPFSPSREDQGETKSSPTPRYLFGKESLSLQANNNTGNLVQQVYNAIVDTRTSDIEYNSECSTSYLTKFYELLDQPTNVWVESDYKEIDRMLCVDDRLCWRRVSDDLIQACLTRVSSGKYRGNSRHTFMEESYTSLHCAAINGNVQLCYIILTKAPALINVVDKYGRQPLHLAAFYGRLEVVKFLIDATKNLLDFMPTGVNAPVDVCVWTPVMHMRKGWSKYSKKLIVRSVRGTQTADPKYAECSQEMLENKLEEANKQNTILQDEEVQKTKEKVPSKEIMEIKRKRRTNEQLIKNLKEVEIPIRKQREAYDQLSSILYAPGDWHVSPTKKEDSTQHYHHHAQRVCDTPNRTRLLAKGSDEVCDLPPEMTEEEFINEATVSKHVIGVAVHHMTGFRYTNEDSAVVHFDEQKNWVRLFVFLVLFVFRIL